jgi:hypothetical protein
LGFPLTLIPPILINWRILCLYIPTYDYRMRKNSPMHFKDRGTVWLMIRCVTFEFFILFRFGC